MSDLVLEALAIIAGRIPDGDAHIEEPIVAQWGVVRISKEDADELLAALELSEWVQEFIGRREGEAAARLLVVWVRLLKHPSTMETLQMIENSKAKQ